MEINIMLMKLKKNQFYWEKILSKSIYSFNAISINILIGFFPPRSWKNYT